MGIYSIQIALANRELSLKTANKNKNMPRFDGTGPAGQGPGTGRGFDPCGGGGRQGFGCWSGCGYGCGYRSFISPKNELAALEDEEKMLEEELTAIREEKAALKDQQK